MQTLLSPLWFLGAAAWYTINGILHDAFVIRGHKGGYDRELLRLLMDGHVLILSGIIMFVSYLMAIKDIVYGPVIALIVAVFMLIYCFMIFPFLKSFVTMAISVVVIAAGIQLLLTKKIS